jgi:hypothetical protein
LGNYADGVYPVEALGVYEPLPDRLKQWPVPELSVTSQSAGRPEVIDHVNSVVIADGTVPSSDLQSALGDKFIKTMSFSNRFAVWIRSAPPKPIGSQ